MHNLFDKKPIQFLIIICSIVFLFEFIFFNSNQILWLILLGAIAYYSWEHYYREPYRVTFWIVIIIIASILLDRIFFRILFGALIIWFIIQYVQNQSDTKQKSRIVQFDDEPIEETEILYSNKWFGGQKIGDQPYQWQDYNSQTLFGETIIDLTQTVLPKGEPLILIRHIAGTIKIIVPYDVEVSIHHSIFLGSVDIFGYGYDQITNRVIHYQTKNYHEANQRVKIYTSMIAGKIEVVRG